MNSTRYLPFIALILPWAAYAQSSVTLYGVIDSAVAYQTHANSSGNSVVSLEQGGEGFFSGSRFGLKGTEDIGGGVKAGFTLENGFFINSGKFDQQGQLFGRQALVHIGNKYGDLALGRQYTTANSMLYVVDPLGVGGTATDAWMVYLIGQRYDNAITYTGKYGPFTGLAEYAFGEVAGNSKAKSSESFGLKYSGAQVIAIGDAQFTHDTQKRLAQIYVAGINAAVGPTHIFASYIYSKRDAGFDSSNGGTDTASITSMSTAATLANSAAISSVFANQRRDDYFDIGASWNVIPAVTLIGSAMYDRTRADGFSGTRVTSYGAADYALSKRTDVYLAVAYDWVHGDWSGLLGNSTTNFTGGTGKSLNGRNNQTTVMAGMRHAF